MIRRVISERLNGIGAIGGKTGIFISCNRVSAHHHHHLPVVSAEF